MTIYSWLRKLRGLSPTSPVRNPRRTKRPSAGYKLQLEHLEDRLAPAVITYQWTGQGGNNLWSNTANWTNGGPTSIGGANTAALVFSSNTPQETSVDDIASLALSNPGGDDIQFNNATIGHSLGGTDTSGGYHFTALNGATITLNTATNGIDVQTGLGTALVPTTETFDGPAIALGANTTFTVVDAAHETLHLTTNSTINLGAFPTGRTLTVVGANNAGTSVEVQLDGVISGSGAIGGSSVVLTSGTLALNAVNTYTTPIAGTGTTVNGGNLFVENNSGLGAVANTDALAGGQIDLDGGISVTQANLTMATGTALFGIFGGADTWNGTIALAAATSDVFTVGADASSSLAINGAISGGNGSATPSTLFVNGGGTADFKVDNSYSGTTIVNPGNTLQVDTPSGLGAGGANNGTTVASGGELLLNFTSGNPLQSTGGTAENLTLAGAGDGNILGALQVDGSNNVVVNGTIGLTGPTTIGTSTGTLTLSGVISDISGAPNNTLTKTGTGTLILSGAAANTYTDPTNINAGILIAEKTDALGASGLVTVANNATLQLGYAAGPAGITLPNAITFLGTTPAAGALASLEQLASGVGGGLIDQIQGTITLPAGQLQIAVDTSPDLLYLNYPNIGGNITGAGGFVLNQPVVGQSPEPNGALALVSTVSNTYGGTTSVDAGLLEVGPQVPGIIEVPGNLNIGDGQPNSAVTGLPQDATVEMFNFSNSIAATSIVTILADGKFDMAGLSNTIAGLNMTGGSVVNSVGGSELTLNGDVIATGFVDLHGTVHTPTITVSTLALNTTAGGNRNFTVNQPTPILPATDIADLLITSVIQDDKAPGGPASSITQLGTSGVMVLEGANTYTGSTTVSTGTLVAANGGALGIGTVAVHSQVSVAAGATLTVAGVTINFHDLTLHGTGFIDPVNGNAVSAALVGYGGGTWSGLIDLAANTSIDDIHGGTLFLSNVISGPGNLDVTGPTPQFSGGTVEMTATGQTTAATAATPNSYGTPANNTTVEAGMTLILDKVEGGAGAFPGTPLTAVPGALAIKGTTPNFVGATNTLGATIPGGVVTVDAGFFGGATPGIEIGTLGTPEPVTMGSGATLNVGPVGASAQLVIAALTMNVGSGNAAPNANPTINLNTNGAGGDSELELTGGATAVTVNGAAGANAAINAAPGATIDQLLLPAVETFTVNPASAGSSELDLDLNVGIGSFGPAVGGITETGGGTMQMSGTIGNRYTGNTTVLGSTLLLNKTAGFAAASGASIPGSTTLTIGSVATPGAPDTAVVRDTAAASNWQLGGTTSGGASVMIAFDGFLDLTLQPAGHMDRIGGATALTMTAGTVSIGNVTLFLDGNVSALGVINATILGAAGGTLDLDGGTRTFTDVAATTNLSEQAIIADGALTKAGVGFMTLVANNTYSGTTTVNAGDLFVNGSQPTSVVMVNAGGTLSGVGVVGAVTVNSGGILQPGDAPGVMTVIGNVIMNTGSIYSEQVISSAPGTGFSVLDVTGTFTIAAGVTLEPNGTTNGLFSGVYGANVVFNNIIDAIQGITGTFTVPGGTPTTTSSPVTFTTPSGTMLLGTYTTNTFSLSVVTAPVLTLAFLPTSIVLGATSTLTFTIVNPNTAIAETGVTLTDTLPAGLTSTFASFVVDGGTVSSNGTTITLSPATIPGGGTLTFSVPVTGVTASVYTDTAGPVMTTNSGTSNIASAILAVVAPPSIVEAFAPTTIALGGTSTLSFTLANSNTTIALTGVTFTDVLPAGLTAPNGSSSVDGGTLTISGGNTITLSGATIPAATTLPAIDVTVTGTAAGFYTDTTGAISSTNGGAGNFGTATITVVAPPVLAAAFSPTSIAVGSTSTLTFTITNPAGNTVNDTGVGLTNTLPAGLTPTAEFVGADGGAFTVTGQTITLTSASIPVGTPLVFTVTVTGTTAGDYPITFGPVTSTNGGTGNTATAELVVVGAPVLAAAFNPTTIALNTTSSLTFTISNLAPVAQTGVQFSDTLPSGLTVNNGSFLVGTGTVNITGGNTITLTNGTIAANSTLSFSVPVTGAAAGFYTDTTGPVSSANFGTGNTATATLTVVAPPAITAAFSPTSIPLGGTSTLTFTLTNPAANTVSETGVAFTDVLPTGLTVVNGSSSVGGGTLTITGGNTITLTGATLGVGGILQIPVMVTDVSAGFFTDTTGAVSSTNGGTGNSTTATLTAVAPPVISAAFSPTSIAVGTTSTLTFTIVNPAINNAVNETGVSFTDTLPAGLTVPNSTSAVGGGTLTVSGNTITLSGASITTNSPLTFSVTVTGNAVGSYTDITSAVTSTNGGTGNSATASLSVVGGPVLAAAFSPPSIPLGTTSTLTFTITNATGTPLTGVGFTDILPNGLTVPNGSMGTADGGTVTTTFGNTITLSGATVPANSSFQFNVTVTATVAGTIVDNTGTISSTNGGAGNSTSATLIVVAPPTIAAAFAPTSIAQGGTTTLTFTISDPAVNTVAETGVTFTDTLPAGLTVVNGVTAVGGGGTLTITGGNTITLTGATVGIGVPLAIPVTVTGATHGVYTITTGPVSSVNGGTGTTATSNTLTVMALPKIKTTASPTTLTLGTSTTAPTLTDTAVLSGGVTETGKLVFTLTGPGGFSSTKDVTLTAAGNGTYTASIKLPTAPTVVGTYTWHVTYAGDTLNTSASDTGAETTVVSKATATGVNTAGPTVTLGSANSTISDSVALSGYFPTGSIVFTVTGPAGSGFTYTQTVAVNGNGTYTASFTLPTSATPGTYTWTATYSGDPDNSGFTDSATEQVNPLQHQQNH